MAYTPFLISDYKLAQQENVEPFMLPQNAFTTLQNAYVRNGVVRKREGYSEFGKFPEIVCNITGITLADPCNVTAVGHGLSTDDTILISDVSGTSQVNGNEYTITKVDDDNFTIGVDSSLYTAYVSGGVVSTFSSNPIMGLLRYIDSLGVDNLICLTNRRAATYSDSYKAFIPIDDFSEILNRGDGSTATYNGTLIYKPILAGSLEITDGVETFTDNGDGTFIGSATGTGTITYSTGVYAVTFNTDVVDGTAITSTYKCQEDIFTGDNTEFFQAVNYDTKLWMTNGQDRIITWNGTVLEPHIFDLTNEQRTTNEVASCKFIKLFRERIYLFDTSENGTRYPQRIRWSQAGTGDIWQSNVSGRGSSIDISTGQWFVNVGFAGEDMVVFFQRSSFLLRYSSNPALPIIVTKLNSSLPVDAPYGIVESELGLVNVGKKSIIATDGSSVKNIDNLIPDYTLTINQAYIKQTFGFYHGERDQIWFLYPSSATVDDTTVQSDKVLIFNILDGCWSYYIMPMSCLGYYKVGGSAGLADYPDETLETFANLRLDSFLFISESPLLLGGSHDGVIYNMDHTNNDNGAEIDVEMKSKRFQTFESGTNSRLSKVDFLLDCDNGENININFYDGFNEESYASKDIDLTNHSGKKWRTVNVNHTSNSHQIGLSTDDENSSVKLLAMRLWIMPTGLRGV